MLTQEQLDQLQPLIRHPKFGKLLQDAIETWKREDVIPTKNTWGIEEYPKNKLFCLNETKQCCLIGASVIGKKGTSLSETIIDVFNISWDDYVELMFGFDRDSSYIFDSEAEKFGQSVNEIINPKEYSPC